MPGKRDAHERLPELIAAAVHVFTREEYPLARMSDLPLSPTPLAATIWEAREFAAEALSGHGPGDAAAELEKILLELFELESRTREAADMLERLAADEVRRHRGAGRLGAKPPQPVGEEHEPDDQQPPDHGTTGRP